MNQLVTFSLIGFSLGFSLIWVTLFFVRSRKLSSAKSIAQDIIEEAEENAKSIKKESQQAADEFSEEQLEKFEPSKDKSKEKILRIESDIADKRKRLQSKNNIRNEHFKSHKKRVDHYQSEVDKKRERYDVKNKKRNDLIDKYTTSLLEKLSLSKEDLIKDLKQQIINETKVTANKLAQLTEEEAQQNSERDAKALLLGALNRFARPYCPERGISYVPIKNDKIKKQVLGPENKHLQAVEKSIGVDIVFDENNNSLSVTGFDPVRRELGRATMEALTHEKKVNEQIIEKVIAQVKKQTFKKIRQDGNRITKELKIDGVSSEIRDMMGSLRYRYSFTQNQYFHCGEVGHLCGLLSSEMNVNIKDGKRAGMLHDIGKAMDHSIDGGHAVIGADFIEKNGEKPHIVHAVRAHHFDETPDTDLAYLVIAADAMSGARPGARRSTAASYSQKMNDLEKIANSFKGVEYAHILSAGREVRVHVNGQKMDDYKSLDLSKRIAEKIENEMTYPGQIKVTVVRQTQAIDMAK